MSPLECLWNAPAFLHLSTTVVARICAAWRTLEIAVVFVVATPTSQQDNVRTCGCAMNKALRSFRAFEPSPDVIAAHDIQNRGLRAWEHASPAKRGCAACHAKRLQNSGGDFCGSVRQRAESVPLELHSPGFPGTLSGAIDRCALSYTARRALASAATAAQLATHVSDTPKAANSSAARLNLCLCNLPCGFLASVR